MDNSQPIVITGAEHIKAVQELTRLHFWRSQAHMKALGFKPRQGWTIRAFNEMYDVKAKTWQDVFNMADAAIRGQ